MYHLFGPLLHCQSPAWLAIKDLLLTASRVTQPRHPTPPPLLPLHCPDPIVTTPGACHQPHRSKKPSPATYPCCTDPKSATKVCWSLLPSQLQELAQTHQAALSHLHLPPLPNLIHLSPPLPCLSVLTCLLPSLGAAYSSRLPCSPVSQLSPAGPTGSALSSLRKFFSFQLGALCSFLKAPRPLLLLPLTQADNPQISYIVLHFQKSLIYLHFKRLKIF